MNKPFLSVVTRHMQNRPLMFARCLASLNAQTRRDFEHIVITDPDPNGSGWAWVNGTWDAHQDEIHGRYILQLDDDDVLAHSGVIDKLYDEALWDDAEIVVFRTDHAELGILPDQGWGIGFVPCHMGGEDFIVRHDLWERNLSAWRNDTYEGDIGFMAAIFKDNPVTVWHDEVLVRCQRVSRGRGE